jgi:Phage integrase, N-terminal SAM-like domain
MRDPVDQAAVSKTVSGHYGPTRVRIPPPPLTAGNRAKRLGFCDAIPRLNGHRRSRDSPDPPDVARASPSEAIARRSHRACSRNRGAIACPGASNFQGSELHVLRMSSRHRPEGIVVRHSRRCASQRGEGCDCRPGYQAQVFSARDAKTIRKTFRTLSDARAWRAEAHSALRAGTLRAPTRMTLAEAAEEWLVAARAEIVRTRSGTAYKPSALRAYEQALRTKVLPALGRLRLSAITRSAVQDLVDALVASGRSPSTVRNAILPLRAIYRRALARADVLVNPTLGLALPPAARSRAFDRRLAAARSIVAGAGSRGSRARRRRPLSRAQS